MTTANQTEQKLQNIGKSTVTIPLNSTRNLLTNSTKKDFTRCSSCCSSVRIRVYETPGKSRKVCKTALSRASPAQRCAAWKCRWLRNQSLLNQGWRLTVLLAVLETCLWIENPRSYVPAPIFWSGPFRSKIALQTNSCGGNIN